MKFQNNNQAAALQKINERLSQRPVTNLAPLGGRSGSPEEMTALKRMSPYNNTFGSQAQIGLNLQSRQLVQADVRTKPSFVSPISRSIPKATNSFTKSQTVKEPEGNFFSQTTIAERPVARQSTQGSKPEKQKKNKTKEDPRKNNSARQYVIKKGKGRRDVSRQKNNSGKYSPTMFTFSQALSTKSAPNLFPIERFVKDSPDPHIKSKVPIIPPSTLPQKIVRIGARKLPQLSTSPIPARIFHSQSPSGIAPNIQNIVQKYSQSVSKERSQKVLPAKSVKFLGIKNGQNVSINITPAKQRPNSQQLTSTQPKPPLAKKREILPTIDENRSVNSETQALLRMADDGIQELQAELQKKRQKQNVQQVAPSGNFNVCFNNSFNTSYNQSTDKQQPQVVIKQETKTETGETITRQVVADLEQKLTRGLNSIKQGGNEKMTLGVVTQTFDEVISKDKAFSSLLQKIKNAYTDYLSELEGKTTRQQVIHEDDLERERKVNLELQRQISTLNQRQKEKDEELKNVQIELEKLKTKPKNHKSFSSITEQSPKYLNRKSEGSINLNLSQSKETGRTEELDFLVQQNLELNDFVTQLQDEITYLKLREKKIMYLIHLLQAKGYPVTQVFETSVKPINTLRFEEFLIQKEKEARLEEEENAKVGFSFHTEDSFVNLVDGPQMVPKKPDFVPYLNFDGLPEYVTSSEEEETPVKKQKDDYKESMKYIKDYYQKHQK